MIRLLLKLIFADQMATLGISQASLVSAVSDKTGDDGVDAVIKIKRLINEVGPDFCLITNWKFLRDEINFNISNAGGYVYSGSDILPATYRQVMAARIQDSNSEWFPLYEKSISEANLVWTNPQRWGTGRPDEFVVTRPESGYWEVMFNRLPGQTYAVYMEIEKQWVDVTASQETVITKEYFPAFAHFVSMQRFFQQGDMESYLIAKKEWWDPQSPKNSMLGRIFSSLSGGMQKKQVTVDERLFYPGGRNKSDYNRGNVGI
jgi:hypothetical protein